MYLSHGYIITNLIHLYSCLEHLYFGLAGTALTITSTVNTGEVASLCAITTIFFAAMGSVTALFTKLIILERTTGEVQFDLLMAMNGALLGLVAITSGCAVVQLWASVVIGMFAAWFYLVGSHFGVKLRLDDAINAIPVHLFNGVWGVIATDSSPILFLIQEAYG